MRRPKQIKDVRSLAVKQVTYTLSLVLLALSFCATASAQQADVELCNLVASGESIHFRALPPPEAQAYLKELQQQRESRKQAGDPESPLRPFTVNYIGAWPGAAQNAFEYAADLLSWYLDMPQPIVVDATWDPLGAGFLASAKASTHWTLPDPTTARAISMAEAMVDSALNGIGSADIEVSMNSDRSDWYFGLDGNPGGNEYDFVTVALHELVHGIGFSGGLKVNAAGDGELVLSPFPKIYDRFTYGITVFPPSLDLLLDQTPAEQGSLLRFAVGFYGTNEIIGSTRSGFGNTGATLYTPPTWNQGSSYSHLNDATYDGSIEGLMTHAGAQDEAIHLLGYLTRGMFQDMGWRTYGPQYINIPSLPVSTDPWGIRLLPGFSVSGSEERSFKIEP